MHKSTHANAEKMKTLHMQITPRVIEKNWRLSNLITRNEDVLLALIVCDSSKYLEDTNGNVNETLREATGNA